MDRLFLNRISLVLVKIKSFFGFYVLREIPLGGLLFLPVCAPDLGFLGGALKRGGLLVLIFLSARLGFFSGV